MVGCLSQGLPPIWKGREVSKTSEVLQGHQRLQLSTANSSKLSIFGKEMNSTWGVENKELPKGRKQKCISWQSGPRWILGASSAPGKEFFWILIYFSSVIKKIKKSVLFDSQIIVSVLWGERWPPETYALKFQLNTLDCNCCVEPMAFNG